MSAFRGKVKNKSRQRKLNKEIEKDNWDKTHTYTIPVGYEEWKRIHNLK